MHSLRRSRADCFRISLSRLTAGSVMALALAAGLLGSASLAAQEHPNQARLFRLYHT